MQVLQVITGDGEFDCLSEELESKSAARALAQLIHLLAKRVIASL